MLVIESHVARPCEGVVPVMAYLLINARFAPGVFVLILC